MQPAPLSCCVRTASMLRWRLPDNPFLIRELRQHRRMTQPLVYLGVLVGAMVALSLLVAASDSSLVGVSSLVLMVASTILP